MHCHRTLQVIGYAIVFSLALSLSGVSLIMAQEATSDAPASIAQQVARAQQLTAQLLSQSTGEGSTSATNPRSTQRVSLMDIARRRKQVLLALMEQAPNEVLRLAIPPTTKTTLPTDVKPYIEDEVAIQGVLNVLIEDYADAAKTHYTLVPPNSRRYTLHFAGNPPFLLSNTRVNVCGIMLDQHMVLEPSQPSFGKTGLSVLATPFVRDTLGEQKTLAILVNFLDNINEPYRPEQVEDLLFNQTPGVNAYYREVSYGQTWLTGKVLGWYTLPYAIRHDCPSDQTLTDALQAAKTANPALILSEYSRFVLVFPFAIGCGLLEGFSSVGKETFDTPDGSVYASRSWLNNPSDFIPTFIHELGHGFGSGHAHGFFCNNVPIRTKGCFDSEYGDPLDVMGAHNGGRAGHFSAVHKERLDWFPSSNNLVSLDHPGIYSFVLEPLEQPTQGIQALKISRPDQQSWYYLEYRQPIGFDSQLGSKNFNGVLIHLIPFSFALPRLLDMDPSSVGYTLPIGERFTDPQGVTIIPRAAIPGANGSTLQVEVTIPPRDLQVPQVGFMLGAYNIEDDRIFGHGKSLQVVAFSDPPVTQISLFRDGELLGTSAGPFSIFDNFGDGAVSQFTWDTGREEDRDVVFTARARNTALTEGSSFPLTVTIDNTPPAVRILSPIEGAIVNDQVIVTVNAEDGNGIYKADKGEYIPFEVDRHAVGQFPRLVTNMYTWDTAALQEGTHTLQVFAFDRAFNRGASAIVHVQVHHVLWGDFNGNGVVTIDELIRAVTFVLGSATPTADELAQIDRDGNGQVSIDEILVAVNNALTGSDAAAMPRSATGAVDLDALMARAQQVRPRRPALRLPGRAPIHLQPTRRSTQ